MNGTFPRILACRLPAANYALDATRRRLRDATRETNSGLEGSMHRQDATRLQSQPAIVRLGEGALSSTIDKSHIVREKTPSKWLRLGEQNPCTGKIWTARRHERGADRESRAAFQVASGTCRPVSEPREYSIPRLLLHLIAVHEAALSFPKPPQPRLSDMWLSVSINRTTLAFGTS